MRSLCLLLLPLFLLAACTDKATEPDVVILDADGDGISAEEGDCDDEDATVAPGAMEICDGQDNDCDGEADEGVTTTFYADDDGDGHGDDATVVADCQAPSGYIPVGGDCDDTEATTHPYAEEVCDGVDNDCDGAVDADDDSLSADSQGVYYTDADGDGYGDDDATIAACEPPEGAVSVGGDCDDTDTAYHPGADESDCTDPEDYNCDGSVGYADADGDGYPACEECDDSDAAISPDAVEVCDGVDNDCDSLTDDEDEVDAASLSTFYADADGDGFGDAESTTAACEAPSGYVDPSEQTTTDCDDTDAAINPDADEVCDGVDNDCDGTVDVGASDVSTFYADADGDGFGDADSTVEDCEQPSGTTADNTDCDDTDADINPDAEEVCDEVDNDCDGTTDVGASDVSTFYADADGDGFGDADSTVEDCEQPSGTTTDNTDCDDGDAAINPDAAEICDGIDTDCDGSDDDPGTAAFEASDGTWTDLTSTLSAGTASIPVDWELSDDGTLWLCEGTWYAAVTVTAADAGITGRSGSEATTLHGGESAVVITAGAVDLSVTGLTVTAGSSADCGGGIAAVGTALTLSDVALTDSEAVTGGGLCMDGGSAALSDVTIDGNATSLHGGGLYCSDATLALSGVTVEGNEAGDAGGGLYLDTCTVSASSLLVEDNESDEEGGGLAMLSSSTLALSGSTFSGNTATKSGGGLYIKDSTLTASSVTLDGNHTNAKGGGLYIDEEDSSLSAMTITDNSASEGGGLYVKDCTITLSSSDVTDNTASSDDGGGLTIEKDGGAEVSSTDWSGNSPDDLYLKHVQDTYSYGSNETFSCSDSACE